jgi:hypothetical protein
MRAKNCQITIKNYYEQFVDSTRTETKNKSRSFSLTTTQDELIKHIAEKKGIGVSTFISEIIGNHLELSPHIEIINKLVPYFDTIKDQESVILPLLRSLSSKKFD